MIINLDMKQYVIDGLRLEDYRKLKDYLDSAVESSPLAGIYWLELEPSLLTPIQREHVNCKPHVFAFMLEETYLSCELLVRIKNTIKCDCMAYATVKQRNWLMDTVDAILEKLDIRI